MCDVIKKLVFCTCGENATSKQSTSEYRWILSRFVRLESSNIMGKILPPIDNLGKGITLDLILSCLNSDKNHFDFNYQPKESDCLHISINTQDAKTGSISYSYLSVIYENGIWCKGTHPAFSSIAAQLSEGKVEFFNTSQFEELQRNLDAKETLFDDIPNGVLKRIDEESFNKIVADALKGFDEMNAPSLWVRVKKWLGF